MAAMLEMEPEYMVGLLQYHALELVYIHSMVSNHFQIDHQCIGLLVPIHGSNIFPYFLQDMLHKSLHHLLVYDLRSKELIKVSINVFDQTGNKTGSKTTPEKLKET